jgi:hypothetical protein
MSKDLAKTAHSLAALHHHGLIQRVSTFNQIGVRRQSLGGTFAILAAVVLNQV